MPLRLLLHCDRLVRNNSKLRELNSTPDFEGGDSSFEGDSEALVPTGAVGADVEVVALSSLASSEADEGRSFFTGVDPDPEVDAFYQN